MALLKPRERVSIDVPPMTLQSPIWFLRLSHTRLSDGEVGHLRHTMILSSYLTIPPQIF